MKRVRARFKLWLSTKDVEGVFGDGKWRLLRAIDRTGSLSSASKLLKISYRKAWGDLKKTQDHLCVNLVEKQRGGNMGGRTILTDEGRKWIKAYAQFRTDVEKQVEYAYKNISGESLSESKSKDYSHSSIPEHFIDRQVHRSQFAAPRYLRTRGKTVSCPSNRQSSGSV